MPRRKKQKNVPQPELGVVLDDLCSRFLINLPTSELESFDRILFAVEAAQWFYEDNYIETYKHLPHMKLKEFAGRMFAHCPFLQPYQHHLDTIYASFSEYKHRVPVRGGILLNDAMDHVLLVQPWRGNAWGWPRGKINQNEDDRACAVREVIEETSFDMDAFTNESDYFELTVREQHVKLYIATNVPVDFPFEPQYKKEISRINWIPIDALPTYNGSSELSFFMVLPFSQRLRKWITKRKKLLKSQRIAIPSYGLNPNDYGYSASTAPGSSKPARTSNSNKSTNTSNKSTRGSSSKSNNNSNKPTNSNSNNSNNSGKAGRSKGKGDASGGGGGGGGGGSKGKGKGKSGFSFRLAAVERAMEPCLAGLYAGELGEPAAAAGVSVV